MSEKNKPVVGVELEGSTQQPEKILLYSKKLWKGLIEVYECASCGFSDESEDNMKLHILTHFPAEQQNTVLEKLVYMEGAG